MYTFGAPGLSPALPARCRWCRLWGREVAPTRTAAPSRKERQACWGARDAYWKCLDESREDASRCKKLRSSFESSCPPQWVSRARVCSQSVCWQRVRVSGGL